MSKFFKAGILLTVLVVPALFYLLLRFSTQNHYTLTRYYPRLDSTTGLPLKGEPRIGTSKMKEDTLFHTLPAFQLLDQDSVVVNNSLIKGKIHIADFFFTRCSTICPKLSTQLTRVQDIFRGNPSVLFLSYSVDPEHDRPVQLRAYAKRYGAISGKWYFLTGTKRDIYQLAQKGYFLPAVDAGVSSGDPDETFIHSEKLVLIDKEGIIRGYYDGTDKEDVERLILETRVLLSTYQNQ